MAPSSSSSRFPPHPYLKTTTLFIDTLPSHVLQEHVAAIFKGPDAISASVSFTRSKNRRNRGALRPRVDFSDLNSAERALATLHGRPIPSLEPPVVLTFSTSPGSKPFDAPDASVSPRLIKTLPPGCTEGKLYDLLRPYGPIYSVRIHPSAGGLVQFWTEAHARNAEIRLASAHPKTILNSYDPRSLFCSNLSLALDAPAFRTHFIEFGNVINAEIYTDPQTGKSRGRGVVTFSQASEASRAMEAMNGREVEWKFLSVMYRILPMASKNRPVHPKGAFEAADASVEEDGASTGTKPEELQTTAPPPPAEYDASPATKPEDLQATAPSTPPSRSIPPPPLAEADVEKNVRILDPSTSTELKALRDLYAAETKRRTAAEAECELLRAELETVKRSLEMAESRLKILQLEADRPLWEAAKKKREDDERAQEEARRRAAEMEESCRKMRESVQQENARKRAAQADRRMIMHSKSKEEGRRRAAELEESCRKMEEFEEREGERQRAAEEARRELRQRRAEERARREKEEQEQRQKEEREHKAKEERERKENEERERREKVEREQREKAERERQAKAERERQEKEREQHEKQERARLEKEEHDRQKQELERKEKAEQERKTKEAREKLEREKQAQKPEEKRRGSGLWTPARALERLARPLSGKESEKARREREAREEKEELERQRREVEEKARREKEQREKEERERREKEQRQEEERERLRREAEEKARREKEEREQREKEERERKEREERERKEKEERDRKEKEAREKLERETRWRAATEAEETRCQRRDEKLRGTGAWTPARALKRFKLQVEEFDTMKFSEAQPLTFRVVPWPVLADPVDLDVEEITWGAVEVFFARIRVHTTAKEYNGLIEKVHRLFHPDKWKSRGMLVTVMDQDLKASLETAGNVVAQAMTPLWRKSKGYNT